MADEDSLPSPKEAPRSPHLAPARRPHGPPAQLARPSPPPRTNIPPPDLMRRTYQALRARARNRLLQDWATDAPTPPYYEYPPTHTPHPFMGLGKFMAGRIHQMQAAKSYLAAHPSWSDKDPNLTCPRCETEPETFLHAILTCPARARERELLLKDVSSLGQDATLWSEPHLIRALSEYITDLKTGFPPDMIPERFLASFPFPTASQD